MRAKGLMVVVAAACSVRGQADDVRREPHAAGTRLVEAIKAGDRTAALALLEQQADVNVPEADGTTALQWAVRQDDADLADRLLRAGAGATAANRYGITALY